MLTWCLSPASMTSAAAETVGAAPEECEFYTHAVRNPDSGEAQCFLIWICEDGPDGFAYTDKSFCYTLV